MSVLTRIRDAFREPEPVRESNTLSDLLLSLDTQGFERIGRSYGDFLDIQPERRDALVKRSRLYWQYEPLAKRVIDMWTQYAFGREWTIEPQDENFREVLDGVLGARTNRRQFSRTGWQNTSDHLLVEGEAWFGYWITRDGIRVRRFDPLEMAEVLTNPDDKDEVWYYRRTVTDPAGTRRTWFYRDWDFVKEDGSPRSDPHPRMRETANDGSWGETRYRPEEGVWVSYLPINTLGTRGYPLLTSAFDWIREYREFMRDRAALSHARAQFAYKGKVKGSQKDVNAVRSAFESPDVETGARTARASTWWENEGVDLQSMSMPTDGASALNDGRSFRSIASLPSGIPDFLLGDTGNANLATATATERPLETMFSSYQGQWVEYIEDMAFHVARWTGFAGDSAVSVDPPDITAKKPADDARAYADLVRANPAIGVAEQPIRMLLTNLGVDDVESAMAAIAPMLGMDTPEQSGVLEAIREMRSAS